MVSLSSGLESWHELHYLAARTGVSVEHLCATVEAATQIARASAKSHSPSFFPTEDEDDLETVARVLSDGDDFDFEIKQRSWLESEHPRDEEGRFSNGSSSGLANAPISLHEVVQPIPYVLPTRVRTAQQARDELLHQGQRLAAVRRPLQVKLARARRLLAQLDRESPSNAAEQAVKNKQRRQVGKQAELLRIKLEADERTDIAKLREVLYVVDPTPVNVRFDVRPNYETIVVPITSAPQKDAAHSGAEEIRRLISAKLPIDDVFFEQETIRRLRSKYAGNRRVKLTDDAGTRVVVHELGHSLEHLHPAVLQKAIAFRESRTRGEPLEPLNNFDPIYGPLEKTRKDKFIDPYMGKVYPGNRDTEIITMGLEYFHSDPLKLATEDPEYFDFIYNTLRGQ